MSGAALPGPIASTITAPAGHIIYGPFQTIDSTHNKACAQRCFVIEHGGGTKGRASVYPSVHFLNRQAAREKLAALRALTDAARQRHLALAADYQKRAEAMGSAARP